MSQSENISIQTLFQEFACLSYGQKLERFHSYFGLVPFSFPKMDMHVSWFYEEAELTALTNNLYEEIKNRHLYEKTITENRNTWLFDVKPRSQSQRIQYNQFLLSLFLSEACNGGFALVENYLGTPDESLSFLNAKCKGIRNSLADIKQYVQKRSLRPGLKLQFARVFYTGFLSFTSDTSLNLHIRHKFVEIYLYSQGLLVAKYLHHLQSLLRKIDADKADQL